MHKGSIKNLGEYNYCRLLDFIGMDEVVYVV